MTIPKKVHISWKDKKLLETDYDLVNLGIKNFQSFNPDWTIEISDDEDVEYYLVNMLSQRNYNLVKTQDIIPKLDIWRLLKLYHEGGLYMDIDRYCNRNLDDLITDDIAWLLPINAYWDFSQDVMCSQSGNPAFACTLELNFQRRRQGSTNIYLLGAQTYMHAISIMYLGELVNTNPGKEKFDQLVDKINQSSFIKTFRENQPRETVLYQGDLDYDTWVQHKKHFYSQYHIQHWTKEW